MKEKRKSSKRIALLRGLRDFVAYVNKKKDVIYTDPVYFEKKKDDVIVQVAIQYNTGYSENLYSFANNIRTQEGGTHEIGFKNGLTRVVNEYAKKQNILKENDTNLSGEDIRRNGGYYIRVSKRPQFEGQTKTKLGNTYIRV